MNVYKGVTFLQSLSAQITALPLTEHMVTYTVRAHISSYLLWLTTKDIPKKTCGGPHGAALPVCIFSRLCCNLTVSCLLTYQL